MLQEYNFFSQGTSVTMKAWQPPSDYWEASVLPRTPPSPSLPSSSPRYFAEPAIGIFALNQPFVFRHHLKLLLNVTLFNIFFPLFYIEILAAIISAKILAKIWPL